MIRGQLNLFVFLLSYGVQCMCLLLVIQRAVEPLWGLVALLAVLTTVAVFWERYVGVMKENERLRREVGPDQYDEE